MKRYVVKRVSERPGLCGEWDKGLWGGVEAAEIDSWLGGEDRDRPCARVKAVYDEGAIYVNFRVEDKYVRAVARGYHGPVWEDSCVEFFFTPGEDVSEGYFNVETNCGGTMLFNRQKERGVENVAVGEADCDKVEIYHSLDKIIEPEIKEEVVWSLQYRLPFEVVRKYAPSFDEPGEGVKWRANFYKCGDETSRPHFMTWNPIVVEEPDFHRPEFFGELVFG
ncbi:hypothetical protein STSP2_03527 [Anaerohalosphaera lusitana]|uniref:Carbohydrate-binding domain-containing protein n=1 Tax=Anaerohalosphaera lusitana TaxID=1936003 RepID=A0A1U9NQW3_9BACT|nr:carbohydrate-binding family 9-like protein [Anaerohalosphaera lusitana]AQT70321.1 hypothetical protein STSP2_03527 [Anaerohalosphaera lusitana]